MYNQTRTTRHTLQMEKNYDVESTLIKKQNVYLPKCSCEKTVPFGQRKLCLPPCRPDLREL